jgi:hypothetical protein
MNILTHVRHFGTSCYRYIFYVLMHILIPNSHVLLVIIIDFVVARALGISMLHVLQKIWLQCLVVILVVALLLLGVNLFFSRQECFYL